ncbi:response regulator transcription factor [Sphingobium sp. PAMC28499]|uniref:response regulator transcription factor n=1 Tax=Sphingobium sp. PAMC28499 TaxID=2565554 RepID=UPI00109DB36A|nr:response regulator transcription factor [Sphingobium sp. PAMC28499]QCB36516.1 response regulator transcription factor [Sphingobium sp. PAMC28499]
MSNRILLVEDDPAVAAFIANILEDANYAVDGPYQTLADGIAAVAEDMPSAAVLDIRLKDGDVGLLAGDLDLYGVPYVFCSGAPDFALMRKHPTAPLILKPLLPTELERMLQTMLH